jgi:hypothetical protein
VEVYAFLVGVTVFKTGETEYLGLAGSIPVHLRHRPAPAVSVPLSGQPLPVPAGQTLTSTFRA